MYIQKLKKKNYGKDKFNFAVLKFRSRFVIIDYSHVHLDLYIILGDAIRWLFCCHADVKLIVTDMCARWQ